jgi:Tfp pilus assembly protein PilN
MDLTFSQFGFGIDFRKNHLILTLLKKSFNKLTLVDYEVHSLLPENQKEEREIQILNLINTFISKYNLKKEKGFLSIPREKTVVRFITLPATTKENLRKVIEYEVPKFTPFEREEIYFDCQILKEGKEELRLIAVFIKKIELDFYLILLKKIGVEPVSIQIPPIGALNLFSYHHGPQESEISVLFDVAESSFEMNLIQKKDWRESFHLPLPQEDRESKMINTFNRSGLEEASNPSATFYVYGWESNEALLTRLKEANSIKAAFPPPLHRIDIGKKDPHELHKIYGSLGIPLQGLINAPLQINLLPIEMRKKVRQIGKPLFVVLSLLALLLALSWGTGAFFYYRNELEAINSEIKARKPEVETIEGLQKRNGALQKEISEMGKIKLGEPSKIAILNELTQLLPNTVWIWNLKYDGKEIEMNGYADSASDLISLIDKSPLFERVEFSAPVIKERQMRPEGDRERERFRIKVRIEGRKG